MSIINPLHSVTTGSKLRRAVLAPVVALLALGLISLVILGGLYTDRAFDLPQPLTGGLGMAVGMPLMALGFALWLWCVMLFRKAKTSPVPVRLPRQLVTKGPYALTRNPMLTGLFSFLTGLGFFLNSISMVLGWTPVFMVLNVIELKLVEEPGLERRFGDSYREYKRRVPMLIPRLSGVNKNGK